MCKVWFTSQNRKREHSAIIVLFAHDNNDHPTHLSQQQTGNASASLPNGTRVFTFVVGRIFGVRFFPSRVCGFGKETTSFFPSRKPTGFEKGWLFHCTHTTFLNMLARITKDKRKELSLPIIIIKPVARERRRGDDWPPLGYFVLG